MAISDLRYGSMRTMLRAALSGNYPGADNPSDGELVQFFGMAFVQSLGAAPLSAARQSLLVAAARSIMAGNLSVSSNPSDSDTVDFFTRLAVDSLGLLPLSESRYKALLAVFADIVSVNSMAQPNPTQADILAFLSVFPALSSGISALLPAHFRDPGSRMILTNPGANQYYITDAFPRVVVLLPLGAGTAFTIEAVWNPSVGITSDPQTNIAVRTSTDPAGAGLAYNQTVTAAPAVDVRAQVGITLPVGTRYVELTGNAYLTGVSAASYTIAPAPSARRQLVFAGDSITTGNIASPVFLGFTQLTRYSGTRFDSVDIYGVSGDSIFNRATAGGTSPPNGGIPGYTAELVGRAQRGSVERAIFMELGTNDYGLNYWTAAAFGVQYAAILDAVHAADPTIRFYCMQQFHRTTETANGVGSTLADYRAAVATAVSTRTSFCTLIDGFTAFSQAAIGAQGDGLHPNAALHATVAAWLAPLL